MVRWERKDRSHHGPWFLKDLKHHLHSRRDLWIILCIAMVQQSQQSYFCPLQDRDHGGFETRNQFQTQPLNRLRDDQAGAPNLTEIVDLILQTRLKTPDLLLELEAMTIISIPKQWRRNTTFNLQQAYFCSLKILRMTTICTTLILTTRRGESAIYSQREDWSM